MKIVSLNIDGKEIDFAIKARYIQNIYNIWQWDIEQIEWNEWDASITQEWDDKLWQLKTNGILETLIYSKLLKNDYK